MNMQRTLLASCVFSSLCALTACGGGGGGNDTPTPDPGPISVQIDNAVEDSKQPTNKLVCNDLSKTDLDKRFCDLTIYQVMVEAFQNDDDTLPHYNIGYGTSDHKGNIKGITNALDYIKGLNANAVWLTPIFTSCYDNCGPLDATGYYAKNYNEIDPHFGDFTSLQELITKTHNKQMAIYLDGVFGHFRSDVVNSIITTPTCAAIGGTTDDKPANTLCADWNKTDTKNFFKNLTNYYIDHYGIDGWRMDQAYQVPLDQWKAIRESVESKAENQTGHKGYIVGEIWGSNNDHNTYAFGTSNDNMGLRSAFFFNLRYGLVKALAVEESTNKDHTGQRILTEFTDGEKTFPSNAIPNAFLTNHDLVRFGDLLQRGRITDTDKEAYWNAHKNALAFLASFSGPITIYYGDEIGQEVPNYADKIENNCTDRGLCDDHVSRTQGRISGFDTKEQDLHDFTAKALKMRQDYPVMTKGAVHAIEASTNSFAIQKYDNDSTHKPVILYMNINNREQKVTLSQTALKEIYDTNAPYLMDPIRCKFYASESGSYTFTVAPLAPVLLTPVETQDDTLCL
ncbi:MAG: alpha-amylase family protein [Succinivibrionaceae bacterium]|nr:alpha-amylase family protein [Succinivibrionaceae bacterium]